MNGGPEGRLPFSGLIERLLKLVGAGERGRHLAGGAGGAFVLKLASMIAAFGASVLLSRTLGAAGYGAYVVAFAWVQLLLVPSLLGTDRLLVREVAAMNQAQSWGLMRGLLRRAHQGVLGASLMLAVVAAGVAWIVERNSVSLNAPMLQAIFVGLPLLPLLAMMRMRQTILLGLDRVTLSQTPEMLLQPVLFLALASLAALLLPSLFSPEIALILQSVAACAGLGYAIYHTRRLLPAPVQTSPPEYRTRVWLMSSLPILAVAGIQVINSRIDILMVGAMLGAGDAGVYTVANRGAQLILLVYFAINAALAPSVASLWAQHDIAKLQDVVRKATRITFAGSLPIALALIVGGHWFLLIFGREFVQGAPVLALLSLSQLVVTGVGAVATVLLMTGHEKEAAWGAAVSAVLNIALNLLLIPRFGMMGAAWALLVGQITSSVVLAILVKRKVGIAPTAL